MKTCKYCHAELAGRRRKKFCNEKCMEKNRTRTRQIEAKLAVINYLSKDSLGYLSGQPLYITANQNDPYGVRISHIIQHMYVKKEHSTNLFADCVWVDDLLDAVPDMDDKLALIKTMVARGKMRPDAAERYKRLVRGVEPNLNKWHVGTASQKRNRTVCWERKFRSGALVNPALKE